jgi:hypothetical protein
MRFSRAGRCLGQGKDQRKVFFSEDKKQETFIPGAAESSGLGLDRGNGGEVKVFWFFFFKKRTLFPTPAPACYRPAVFPVLIRCPAAC